MTKQEEVNPLSSSATLAFMSSVCKHVHNTKWTCKADNSPLCWIYGRRADSLSIWITALSWSFLYENKTSSSLHAVFIINALISMQPGGKQHPLILWLQWSNTHMYSTHSYSRCFYSEHLSSTVSAFIFSVSVGTRRERQPRAETTRWRPERQQLS